MAVPADVCSLEPFAPLPGPLQDMHSEKVVQQALDAIMVGRTSIVVAHRLSTIRNANKIALVHRGSILEQVRVCER